MSREQVDRSLQKSSATPLDLPTDGVHTSIMKYATLQSFAGQRASIGRIVVISVAGSEGLPRIRAGLIAAIDPALDAPRILDLRCPEQEPSAGWAFCATLTPAEAEAIPAGSWTWPPRI